MTNQVWDYNDSILFNFYNMSERFDFDEFLSQFNLKPSSLETDSKVTYGNLVLGEYGMDTTVFPMRVLQVLETPRGPTEFQE